MAFELREGTLEDIPDIAAIYVAAHDGDDIWGPIMSKVQPREHLAWLTEAFQILNSGPNRRWFVIKEVMTG
jgi:hypothetical protein